MNKVSTKPIKTDASITVSNIIDSKSMYDLDPPYQRGKVWSNEWKNDLIRYMFDGLPLSPITLVEKTNEITKEEEYLVLDGKQRISTLFDFIDNQFKVTLDLKGEQKKFSYSQICLKAQDKKDENYLELSKLYKEFRNYNFRSVVYPDINWADQINIFKQINHSKELSKFDKFNTNFPFAKQLVNYLFKTNCIKFNTFLINKFDKKEMSGENGEALFQKFRFIAALMGQNTENPSISFSHFPPPQPGRETEGKKFIKTLDGIIEKYMHDFDDKFIFDNKNRVKKMLDYLKWNKLSTNMKALDDTFTLFNFKKQDRIYNWAYFILFILEKQAANIITINMLKKHKIIFNEIYTDLCLWANSDGENSRRAGTTKKQLYYNKLEELLNKSGVDLGIKNSNFSKKTKSNIIENANGKCEICNSENDLEFDHVLPASLASNNIGGLLCKKCNISKSDNTIESLQANINYINSKLENEKT